MKTTLLFSIVCFSLALSTSVDAKAINAASVELPPVRAAVAAAVDGDTVRIPAGTATWIMSSSTEEVRIDKRAITIMGAGIDRTIIKDGSNGSSTPFRFIGQEGKPFRICHMTFSGYDGVNFPAAETVIAVMGTCKNFRIDHIRFLNSRNAIYVGNPTPNVETYGLIDHCNFELTKLANPGGSLNTIWYGGGHDSAYARPLSLGTTDALYLEDNYVNYSVGMPYGNAPWIAPMDGTRLVVRRNTIINSQFEIYRITGGRASLSCEIYDNIFRAEGPYPNTPAGTVFISGGTGVIFNNTVTGTNYQSKTMSICNDRIYNSYGKYGKCDGTNPYDGNLIAAGQPGAGYPCLDQPGRGVDMNGDGVQELAPWYEWNNKINGQDLDFSVRIWTGSVQDSQYIKEGREFFNDTPMPGYTTLEYPHPLAKADASPGISRISEPNGSSGLLQVVSNPFSRSISIELSARPTQQNSVNIYNIRGQQVADLTAQFADQSSVQWNTAKLSNGVYLIRADVGGQVHIARAILQNN